LYRWLLPVLYSTVLLGTLLFVFPFDTGYATERSPLGFALWSTWTTTSKDAQDYSYCLLVPVIVAYLVFERSPRIARAPIRGINVAMVVILLGLLLFWIGSKAGKQYMGCGGIQLLLAGIILWFWGVAVFRMVLFAWALLSFAWPLPFIDTSIAFPLRMMVSGVAYHVLNLIDIPCLRNGTAIISAPNPAANLSTGARFQIDIADPCSGIHSLLALLMFSALYSYFFLPRRWQQWTVFLSAIPLTIVGNVVRILLLVVGSINFGTTFAIGTNDTPSWYHEGCGYAVFAVVLGLEFLLGYAVVVFEKSRLKYFVGDDGEEATVTTENGEPPASGEVPPWRGYVTLSLTGLMVIVFLIRPPPGLPPEAGVLMSLPDQVTLVDLPGGRFSGVTAPVTAVEHERLPKDTEFARMNYEDFHGHFVYFSIVLSGLQQYTIHPPEICLVAQGWRIVATQDIPIRLASGHNLIVRNLTVQHDAYDVNHKPRVVESYFMYWYVADGVVTASQVERNWISSWDRVVHNRNHRWAYVFAMSPITDSVRADGLNPEQTREMMAQFIQQIVPTFQKSELAEPNRT